MQDYTIYGYPIMGGLLFLFSSLLLIFHNYGNRKYYFWLIAAYFYCESGIYIALTFYAFKQQLSPYILSDDFLRVSIINFRFAVLFIIIAAIGLTIYDVLFLKKGIKR